MYLKSTYLLSPYLSSSIQNTIQSFSHMHAVATFVGIHVGRYMSHSIWLHTQAAVLSSHMIYETRKNFYFQKKKPLAYLLVVNKS